MQAHVYDKIDHVEYLVKSADDETIDSVWFLFGDSVPERPSDSPAVVFWIRSEQHRQALRTALLMAADALVPTQADDALEPSP